VEGRLFEERDERRGHAWVVLEMLELRDAPDGCGRVHLFEASHQSGRFDDVFGISGSLEVRQGRQLRRGRHALECLSDPSRGQAPPDLEQRRDGALCLAGVPSNGPRPSTCSRGSWVRL
jgi:hypothetical protein